MSFELRYSAHSGNWQTVGTTINPATRTILASGTIAKNLDLSAIHTIASQSIVLNDKVFILLFVIGWGQLFILLKQCGYVYAIKLSADLEVLIPYPIVFERTAGTEPRRYDLIAPFCVLN
jgi:hypothetical protein